MLFIIDKVDDNIPNGSIRYWFTSYSLSKRNLWRNSTERSLRPDRTHFDQILWIKFTLHKLPLSIK